MFCSVDIGVECEIFPALNFGEDLFIETTLILREKGKILVHLEIVLFEH